MTNRIFRSTVLVAAVVLLCSLVCILGCLYGYFDGAQISQLKDELSIAVIGTEQGGESFLEQLNSGHYRLTWVSAEGTVLYDTDADESQMENHANREEIREDLANYDKFNPWVFGLKLLPDYHKVSATDAK